MQDGDLDAACEKALKQIEERLWQNKTGWYEKFYQIWNCLFLKNMQVVVE